MRIPARNTLLSALSALLLGAAPWLPAGCVFEFDRSFDGGSADTDAGPHDAAVDGAGDAPDLGPVCDNDGTLEPDEACDTDAFGGKTCHDFTDSKGQPFDSGRLTCTATCTIDTSTCERIVLDPKGTSIASGTTGRRRPAIASDGKQSFLVVWVEDGATPPETDIKGVVATVTAAGISAGTVQTLANAKAIEDQPAVAWTGTQWVVTYRLHSTTTQINAQLVLVSSSGTKGPSLPLSSATTTQDHPSIASDDKNHLAVWSDARNGVTKIRIYGAVATGTLVNDGPVTPVPSGVDQHHPVVGYSQAAGTFLVVYENRADDLIYAAAPDLTRAGTSSPLASATSAISPSSRQGSAPAMMPVGKQFFVTWIAETGSASDVFGQLVTKTGAPSPSGAIVVSDADGTHRGPAVAASSGGVAIVVWEAQPQGASAWNLGGARVDLSGSAPVLEDPDGIVVQAQPTAGDQRHPAVAVGAEYALVVWEDTRSGAPEIYAARVGVQP